MLQMLKKRNNRLKWNKDVACDIIGTLALGVFILGLMML